jgi:DNA-binding NtrC family response regulator
MMSRVNILVVDDEEIVRESLAGWLEDDGYFVETADSGDAALKILQKHEWNLAMVDLKMPGMDGICLMEEIRKVRPETTVLIMTAYATVDTAVKAMKEGAYDYVVKPFNPEDLSLSIRKIIEHQELVKENLYLRKELKKQYRMHDLISKSHRMQEIFELVRTVARSSSTVLVRGESGTGKELLSRAIHMESPRSEAPFISLSCAALTETLLESELFGYEKGAFTGADSTRIGKFELAGDGTLFLDEIGDISPKLQMDLLRVLEQREFTRIGGQALIPVRSRIIAATNLDLQKAITEGRFREDLYYRLNVISIHLPPLRERKEDIPLLVEHFITTFNVEMGKAMTGVSETALRLLMGHEWPGNARELRNVIERAMVVAKGKVILDTDILVPERALNGAVPRKSLDEVEREHIRRILIENRWNIKQSAQVLGIDRVTLYNKIRKYELNREDAGC